VSQHHSSFNRLVVLAAEVSWKQKRPEVARAALGYDILRNMNRPVGLALRIGPHPGPFATNDSTALFLADLAAALVAEAAGNRVPVSELHLDFDCAESKLDGYCQWVAAIHRKLPAIPITITALPSWLRQPDFKRLAGLVSNYVLQVHSLERPGSFNAPFTLCNPEEARSAVHRAQALGFPFRVALPTYGYLVAFDARDRFIGLSAEGPRKSWPAGTRTREVRTSPLEMARLARQWDLSIPGPLQAIIWYRFPSPDDVLNWRWPTLAAIVAGRFPQESIRVESRRVESGLVEISLVNDGELDISSRLAITARWQNARMVAGDGLRGFELADLGPAGIEFRARPESFRLPAGETLVAGWIRLSEGREVSCAIERRE
jgi:hypothetical protein